MNEYTENGETFNAPKYVSDEDRLDGFSSAGPFDRNGVELAGITHPLAFNSAEKWRVVVAWGEGNDAWNALNEIHALYHDSHTLADHRQDVHPIMEERFGHESWEVNWPGVDGSENME